MRIRVPDRTASTSNPTARRQLVRQVVFRYNFQGLLKDFPELDCLVVCGQEIMRRILAATPLDLVDLLLNLKRLQVVKLGLVRLKLGMELVLASLLLEEVLDAGSLRLWSRTYCFVPFEKDHTTALITGREIVTRLVELDGGNDIRWITV